MDRRTKPLVEILMFPGCPNVAPVVALVEKLGRELDVEPELRLVEVLDADAAVCERFLGSPTIRVEGRDVEPGADERDDYSLSCRVLGRWLGAHDELNAGRFGPIVWDAFLVFGASSDWEAAPSALLGTGTPVIGETSKLGSAVSRALEPASSGAG